jgi:hypothetical protein
MLLQIPTAIPMVLALQALSQQLKWAILSWAGLTKQAVGLK